MSHLPSLQTLRAFEAAARLHSYSRAAAELHLTHGAISHRIRELELLTGQKLFRREGNHMRPTLAANRLVPSVQQALALLSALFPPALAATPPLVLMISVMPSFARHWLLPRLDAFHVQQPDIRIELDMQLELVRPGADGIDAALRFGGGHWPGLHAEHLIREVMFPVCAPGYLAQWQIKQPADLARCALLRHSWQPWTPWFRAAGLLLKEPDQAAVFDDAGELLEAAASGAGMALLRSVLVKDALLKGRLIAPFEIRIDLEHGYYFVFSAMPGPRSAAITLFKDWLQQTLVDEFPDLA